MQRWGGVLYYLMAALTRLPDMNGLFYRVCPDRLQLLNYPVGGKIQYGAFFSVTADLATATAVADTATDVILRLRLKHGRAVEDYSCFPDTQEVVASARARFVVAHEPRPFVVAAGGGSVLARGTIFDVTLRGHGASVALIEGLVDVRQPASGTAAGSPLESGEVTRLTAGHGIAIGGGKGVVLQATAVVQPDWPSDLRDFRNVPLRDLLAEANRYADRPLVLTEPQLGDLRVSGIFRVREPARLAANLAELLDLSLMESPAGIALGRRCDPREKNSCLPS